MERLSALSRYGNRDTDVRFDMFDGAPLSYRTQVLHPYSERINKYQKPIVLDLAAGAGSSSDYLEVYKIRTIRLDISGDMLEKQKRKDRVKTTIGPMPFPDNFFNGVHFKDALVHCPNRGELLKEIFRVLRPDGELLLTTNLSYFFPMFHYDKAGVKDRVGKIFFGEDDYAKKTSELEKMGKDITHIGPPYYPVIGLVLGRELRKSGLKVQNITNWTPDKDEKDWYPHSQAKRTVYSLVKPIFANG